MPSMFHYARNGQQHGPVTSAHLRELAAAGELKHDDLVWQEGMANWEPAAKIKGLFPSASIIPAAAAPPAFTGQPAAVQTSGAESTGQLGPDRFATTRALAQRYADE